MCIRDRCLVALESSGGGGVLCGVESGLKVFFSFSCYATVRALLLLCGIALFNSKKTCSERNCTYCPAVAVKAQNRLTRETSTLISAHTAGIVGGSSMALIGRFS